MKVPVSSPIITDDDLQEVHNAVDKAWFTEGRQCAKFRGQLAKYTNQNYVQLVNSGSSANLVSITSALEQYNNGRLILTSALAFPTTVSPIYQNNKIPVYVDTDPETLSPDIGQIAYLMDKYGDDICGGIFTHTLGFPYDEHLVRKILVDKFFIADCCDALGAKVRGEAVGSQADISTHSFFPAHHITTGEGGAIHTNDEKLFKAIRSLTNWGRDCYCQPGQSGVCGKRFEHVWETLPEGYDHKYTFTRLGYNLKMTELQAAMGVTQLVHADTWKLRRCFNWDYLSRILENFSNWTNSVTIPDFSNPSPFGFPIIMKVPGYASNLISHLENNGISTRRIFAGNITRQPGYANLPYVKLDLENTDYLMENAFWIGCGPWMTNKQRNWIEEVVINWFNEKALF